MKKLIALFLGLTFLAACNSNNSLESKKTALAEKATQLDSLTAEIARLEKDIAQLDTTKTVVDEKLTPVTTLKISPQKFNHFLQLTGTVNSKENVLLSAESMGRVVSIPAKEGQRVRKGDVLVQLNAAALEEQMAEARSAYNLSKTTFERRERLWKDSIGSEIEYLNAETQYKGAKNRLGQVQAQLNNARIVSPINGRVDEITVNTGEFVAMGSPVVRVVDMNNLEIEADISEEYLGQVKTGDTVIVTVDALGLVQKQPIVFTGQYINPANRSFKIKVGLDNSDQLIKPNLLASLKIRDYQSAEALVVPASAIKQDLKGEYLFVLSPGAAEPTIAKRYIKKGYTFNDKSEIIEGLKPGDQVVINGYNQITAGDKVALK
jgi:RND family efflux transporter MFP subunit